LAAAAVADEVDWSIANRPDDKIKGLVQKLHDQFVKNAGQSEDPAVVLSRRIYIDAARSKHRICENQIIFVYDPERGEVATRDLQFPPNRDIESIGAWIYRADGKLERLQEENVRVQEPRQGMGPSAVVAFPQIRKGDTLGWSVVLKAETLLTGRLIGLSDDFPVKHCSVRVMTDGNIAYKIFAHNLRTGKWGSQVKGEKNGAHSDVIFTFVDLPADKDEPYSPPYVEREPYCVLSLRGIYNEGMHRWLYNVSWNQTALLAESLLEKWGEPTGKVKQQAQSLVAGVADQRARVDAFYRFVRDEILLVSPFEVGANLREVDVVLDNRNGTSWDQGLLLYALCRAAGAPARAVFARSRDWGELDQDNPDLMQFSDILVEYTAEPGRFYAPTCKDCPPGVLPFEFRGAPAMTIKDGLKERYEEFMTSVYKEAGAVEHLFMDKFEERIKEQGWHVFWTLPGDPEETGSSTTEIVDCDSDGGRAELRLLARGFSHLGELMREHGKPEDCIEAYLGERYQGAEVVAASMGERADAADETEIALEAELKLTAPPAAVGDTWIIPAEILYGEPFLASWSGPERGPFHIEATQEYLRIWRMPLPDGWNGVSTPALAPVGHPQVSFVVDIRVEDRELVVERRYVLKHGTVPTSGLAQLDAAINQIRDFERSPLVLQKANS
jgi:hypothetical protein